jgi:hypothetical protein
MAEEGGQAWTGRFFRDLLQVIGGHESLVTLLDYYPPECRTKFTARDIEKASDSIAATRNRYPVRG